MPSEPRTPTDPTLEELSAFIDNELDADSHARVAEHVAGCEDCQAQLDGLRQTAHAVRALPMETPPRPFTIPLQPRRSFRWAPVGWLGGLAAAVLVVIFGVQQLHFQPAANTASTSTVSGGLAAAAPHKQVAPAANVPQALDSNAFAARAASSRAVIVDPRNSSRSLAVGTDATSYPPTGIISLHVATTGLSASEASSVRLLLIRETGQSAYSVQLLPPSSQATLPYSFDASYSIPQMQWPAPVAGSYMLQVTIDMSGGSTLVAQLPLTITP